jgi:hypothetical protein
MERNTEPRKVPGWLDTRAGHREAHAPDKDRDRALDAALDEALEETFPASDAVNLTQPPHSKHD